MEIQDLLQWLDNTDLRMSSSKTMWGMPDSASERLNAHLVGFICQNNCLCKKVKRSKENKQEKPCWPIQELCNEMDSKLHTYSDVKNAINRMLESSNVVRGSRTEHSLSMLEQKWASVYSKVQERKVI